MILDDLYAKPGHLIRRAHQISVALFMEEVAGADITPVQYGALVAIRTAPGIDATRVSEVIAFDRSTLGNVLERLEDKGYVERRPSTEDRRVKLLYLTDAGEKLLEQVEPAVLNAQARTLAPLTADEARQFMLLLEKVVENNNENSRAPLRRARTDDES